MGFRNSPKHADIYRHPEKQETLDYQNFIPAIKGFHDGLICPLFVLRIQRLRVRFLLDAPKMMNIGENVAMQDLIII